MEAISARFAPFPPRRFFISARPSASKPARDLQPKEFVKTWTSKTRNLELGQDSRTCKDFIFWDLLKLGQQPSECHISFQLQKASRLAISEVVNPLCHGERKSQGLLPELFSLKCSCKHLLGSWLKWRDYLMDHERLSLSLSVSLKKKGREKSRKKKGRKKGTAFRLFRLFHLFCLYPLGPYPFLSSKATNLPVGSSLQHLLWNLLNASTKQQRNEILRCQNGACRNGFWWLVVSPCLVHALSTNYKKCVTHDVDLNWSKRI